MNLLILVYTKLYGTGSLGFNQIGPKQAVSITQNRPKPAAVATLHSAQPTISSKQTVSPPASPVLNEARLLRALKEETSRLRKANALLQEEPRKSRERVVLLALALTSVYLMVNFALFMMAEEAFGHLYSAMATNTPHGQVNTANRKFKLFAQAQFLLFLGTTLTVFIVPITHLSGEYLHRGGNFRFYQPLQGGRIYVALQAVGWFFYAVSLLAACVLFFITCFTLTSTSYHHRGLSIFSGILGNLAQALMVCSLLMFQRETDIDDNEAENEAEAEDEDEAEAEAEADEVGSKGRERRSSSMQSTARKGLERDLWLDAGLAWNDGSYRASGKLEVDGDTSVFALFLLLNVCVVCNAVGLGFSSELEIDQVGSEMYRVVAASLSFLCIVVAAFITHGLGGELYLKSKGWRFFQPFVGGTVFVLLQTVTWAVLAISLVSQAVFVLASIYISTRIFYFSGLMKIGSITAIIAQALLILSLSFFQRAKPKLGEEAMVDDLDLQTIARMYYCANGLESRGFVRGVGHRMRRMQGLYEVLGTLLVAAFTNIQYLLFAIVTIAFYQFMPLLCLLRVRSMCHSQTPEHLFQALFHFSMCVVSFTFAYSILKTFRLEGPVKNILLVAVTLVPLMLGLVLFWETEVRLLMVVSSTLFASYNLRTYAGVPEKTGCREWKAFTEFGYLWNTSEDYFGANVVKDEALVAYEKKHGPLGFEKNRERSQYFVGFHPHGILPFTMLWLPLSNAWKDKFGSFRFWGHTASIIHYVPIMRDLCQWMGVRDVSRASVDLSLKSGISPCLVVGGQSEMFLSRSFEKTIRLHRQHRGFVRMAIRHGVPLLPMFSFGEHMAMDNVYLPRTQAWFKSFMGFPAPFFPYGRFYLPLPRRTPITVCVGAPVYPLKQNKSPSRSEIDELHGRYFQALEQVFERNKERCGFPNHVIQWVEH